MQAALLLTLPKKVLAGLCIFDLQSLAWGPNNGLAGITVCSGTIGPDHNSDPSQRLHLLLPGHEICSMTLKHNKHGSVVWNASGDRLLVHSGHLASPHLDTHLITSTCRAVNQFERSVCSSLFSFDGRHVVVTEQLERSNALSIKLCRACDGSLMFSMAYPNLFCSEVAFSIQDDQLLLVHESGVHVMSFEWGPQSSSARGRQLCNAVSAAASWASSMAEKCRED